MLLARFFQKPKVAAAVVYKPLTLEIFVEKTDECSFYQRAVSQGFLFPPAIFQVGHQPGTRSSNCSTTSESALFCYCRV